MTPASIFDMRAGLVAAVTLLSWAAIAFLTVIVMHLHLRLQHLESMTGSARSAQPYSRFLGGKLSDLVSDAAGIRPDLVLALSSDCKSCSSIFRELQSRDWTTQTLLVWTDRMQDVNGLGPHVRVVSDGPALAARLGIRITPFAFRLDQEGKIIHAGPVNSLGELAGNKKAAATA